MDNYELYSEVCDYLQEAVNNDLMTEEEAMAIEAEAAERYGIIEESTVHEVTGEFLEAVLDDYVSLFEAADTTDAASLASYTSTMKELAGVYKNNIKSAEKAVKASKYKEAKSQIADAKKALAKAKATTVAYKDSIPGTVCTVIIHLYTMKKMLAEFAKVVAGASLVVGAAKVKKDDVPELSDKDRRIAKGIVAGTGALTAAAGLVGTAVYADNMKSNAKVANDYNTKDTGKIGIIRCIQNQEKIIAKLEKAIEKKMNSSK